MSYDFVIVGGGSAGSTMAARLTEDPNVSVCLLEAGGDGNGILVRAPAGVVAMLPGRPKINNWAFQTEPQPGLNGRRGYQPRGKALGGSSAINAMLYVRGQKEDYDNWADLGNGGWDWDSVLPYFKKAENNVRGADTAHGDSGPLQVSDQKAPRPISEAYVQACSQNQLSRNEDFNTGDNEGAGYWQTTIHHSAEKNGERCSAAAGYLFPVIDQRPNLTVITRAHATRIIFDEKRAVGVAYRQGKHDRDVRAGKEVILCGGAFQSPQLLQLSGIGEANALQAHDIPVHHALPGVGQNLQDHLQIRTIYQVDNTVTLNQRARTPWGMAMMGLEYFLKKTGPLTMPPSQLGAFAKSDPSQPSANIEWHVQPLSLDKFGSPLHRYNAITPSVCNLRPSSRGTVTLKSANPHDAPAIAPNYLSTADDLDVAVAGLRYTREIMAAPALAPFNPTELKPGPDIQSEEALQRAAGDLGTTIFHPVGTCKMGPQHDPGAVVDDELRVHGIKGLRVIDASIMPTITSGNTNAPTVMIAERGAQFIRRDYGHSR